MILTEVDILQYIPFTYLVRDQVAELLGVSASTVDVYSLKGKRIDDDGRVYLRKEQNGRYYTSNVIAFKYLIDNTKSKV